MAVGISVAAFVGMAPEASAKVGAPTYLTNWSEFQRVFVPDPPAPNPPAPPGTPKPKRPPNVLAIAVQGFFANGGSLCHMLNVSEGAGPITRDHLAAFDATGGISLLLAPGYANPASIEALIANCEGRSDRFAILDTLLAIDPLSRLT
ncbi:MAG: hypothetical protein ACJAVS_001486 [Paracoccaceae bacterium]|jgi:hypothetical protein